MGAMEQRKLNLFLVLGLVFVCVNVSGQRPRNLRTNEDVSEVTVDTIAISAEVAKKYELEKKIEDLNASITEKRSCYNQKTNELSRLAIKKRRSEVAVEKKKVELQKSGLEEMADSIKTLASIQGELIAQKETLEVSLEKVNDKIDSLQQKLGVIEELKERNAQIVWAKYDDILKQEFSKIEYKTIDKIVNECNQYSDNKTIQSLISRTEQVKSFKQTFDSGMKLLETKYDAVKVQEMIDVLTQKLDMMSDAQRNECSGLIEKLDIYDEGIALLCDYINTINNNRKDPNYATFDFEDNSRDYQKKNKDAINKCIRVIPYLDKAFNTFNSVLSKNVKAHPPIESEVLDCQIAADNK